MPDYPAFLAHVGRRPSAAHTIERIDNDQGYKPGNVRWATRAEQNRNTRANHFLEFDGRRQTLSEWARETGINHPTILRRLNLGWTIERAFSVRPIVGRNQTWDR